jgi:hypothetical protein
MLVQKMLPGLWITSWHPYMYITLSEMLHCPWSYFLMSNKQLWLPCLPGSEFLWTTSFRVSEPALTFFPFFAGFLCWRSLHVLHLYVGKPLTLCINQTICTCANLVTVSLLAWRWGIHAPLPILLGKKFNVPARLYRIPLRLPICVHMLCPGSRYISSSWEIGSLGKSYVANASLGRLGRGWR